MNIVFVVNNKNGGLAAELPKLEQYCQQKNLRDVRFIPTRWKKHAIEIAKEATGDGCSHVIAVGGDGTLHEVINGILQSNISANEYPIIGLLPYGSANDFARTVGLSNSLEELLQLIQSHTTQEIDLGKVVFSKNQETHYFINVTGVGLGALVIQKLERSSNSLSPSLNYFIYIVKGFISYAKKKVKVKSDSWHWRGKLLQMVIANGRYFGNAICATPDAKLIDGQFQVAIFGNLSIWDYLKNLIKLKTGEKIKHPEVSYYTTKEVLIESSDSCGIEADGEYLGLAPAAISVLPKAISFLMPPKPVR
ncbi:diacylglycerol/lipid kinase family protein [Algoriphagus namhaensis]|uniref:Diacylglycerol/lipid kinase family protein n=1 Tax=Algoriphagus namhaensis TaxID=915353 RepID=A0ABV8AU92_9BACT